MFLCYFLGMQKFFVIFLLLIAVCQVLPRKKSGYNLKVAGSNPAPATNLYTDKNSRLNRGGFFALIALIILHIEA